MMDELAEQELERVTAGLDKVAGTAGTQTTKAGRSADWTSGLSIGNLKRRSRTIKKQSAEDRENDRAGLAALRG
jgi:hypothetical protein